jgi:hypothetical protein
MMEIFEFEAIIMKSDERGSGAYVHFPYDLESRFGTKGQVKVKCEFDGVDYRGSIVNMGNGPCIGILKSIREKIGKQAGDSVHVKLWKDEEVRIIKIPADLRAAFESCPENMVFFEKLSYSNQREYIQWIESAKKIETRNARVEKTLDMLGQGIKSPKAK